MKAKLEALLAATCIAARSGRPPGGEPYSDISQMSSTPPNTLMVCNALSETRPYGQVPENLCWNACKAKANLQQAAGRVAAWPALKGMARSLPSQEDEQEGCRLLDVPLAFIVLSTSCPSNDTICYQDGLVEQVTVDMHVSLLACSDSQHLDTTTRGSLFPVLSYN